MKRAHIIAIAVYFLLLGGIWLEVRSLGLAQSVGHLPSAFLCFALLLAPEWFFAFGLADWLTARISGAVAQIVLPATLTVPYLLFSIPRGAFDWRYALAMAWLPVVLSAILWLSPRVQRFLWQDAVVLITLAAVLELRWLSPAWPYNGLGALPKLYLADVALYLYLVVRRIEGAGYSFVPALATYRIALREWLFFLPLALLIGFATGFIRFVSRAPSVLHVVTGFLVIFLLTAVPEEIFFRGILQNLLEGSLGRMRALVIASVLFGLSHFHKQSGANFAAADLLHPTLFNWRYVILASIAGFFYGRAWRARRELLASSTTHTLVDLVWGLWFR